MNKEKVEKIFKDTFIAVENFKQSRIRLSINELKQHLESDAAIEGITELFKALKQSEHMLKCLKEGLPKVESEKQDDNEKNQ